jgi:hypothetical protein
VNVADGRVHGVWNVNVTCKGYGEAGGMFGISNQKSPCILSAFPTSTSDTSIVPKVYTAASHFGYPDNEKFLTKVFIDGRGVTSLKIYRRMGLGENFTLDQTITNPKQVTNLPGTCRFGDLYLLIEGNPLFLIRTLGVEFNVGGLIYE